ncbi:phytoene desaturase family protein [Balneola sp. MJW-20]|uniref:phytoene desaturase family protein n=1 Tax=Gracilimonas aurantiaca TaxID=3234185 RepID=UPI003466D8A6
MNNKSFPYDAVVVGSGPNGLGAAIRLAQEGLKVLVLEAEDTIGGGTRTKEVTEPGFLHDICSAVHPTAKASPFLSSLPLEKYGLEFVHPEYPYAHPLENGDAVFVHRDLDKTLENLGVDAGQYEKLFSDFVDNWTILQQDLFGSLRIPKNPLTMARFGWYGMFSADLLSKSLFKSARTRALFAGCAAHSIVPLEKAFTASFGLVLGVTAHTVGWPMAKGGSSKITEAMASHFKDLGGEILTEHRVSSASDIPEAKCVMFDLTPFQIAEILKDELPGSFRNRLLKYKYGPGAFKIDYALSDPVPWTNEACRSAGTLHLGGTFEEIAAAEKEIWEGNHPDRPYVLIAQSSVADNTRAPEGKHTLWAYCHVPNGSEKDMTRQIEDQIERYAPGFRETIISKRTMNTKALEKYNSNYIGGDINGGAQFARQLFGRPVLKWDPYHLPVKGNYICSSSSPPGGGVHGMAGFNAANSALKREFGIKS